MTTTERTKRLVAFSKVGAVWLAAGAVGVWIGLDLGSAIFG